MTSSRIPSDLREVTASWLTEALHSKEVSSKASVTGYSAETIAGGNGFMNQVVRLGSATTTIPWICRVRSC